MSSAPPEDQSHPLAPGPEHFLSGRNEVVVAIPHLNVVRASLEQWGIPVASVKTSAPLGLALVKLRRQRDLPGDVRTRLKEVGGDQPAGGPPTGDGPPVGGPPRSPGDYVGQVLEAIKQTFGDGPGRWEPTIGRNRLVGHVAATDGRVIVAYGEPELVGRSSGLAPRGSNLGSVAHRGDVEEVVPVRRTRVGVADTPIRPHAWLEGSWLAPYPTPLPSGFVGAPNYRAGHATAVTGLVLDRAPDADVQVRAILDDEGAASSWDVGTGLIEFDGTGIDILNISFACYTLDGQPPLCLSAAINRLPPETLVVAAAGNYGSVGVTATEVGDIDLSKAPAWPAALPNVVAVGSCTGEGARSAFSPDAPWISVLSAGEKVTSLMVRNLLTGATTDDEFANWTGTSFSAARVTGTIAAQVKPGSVSASEVWNAMLATGIKIIE